MRSHLHSFRVVLLGGLLLYTILPTTAKADQIVVLVDEPRAQDLRELWRKREQTWSG